MTRLAAALWLICAAGLTAGCDDDDPAPADASGPVADAAAGDAEPDGGPDCSPPLDDTSGSPTGLTRCGADALDRAADDPCPAPVEGEDYRACDLDDGACREDADCGEGGRCIAMGEECGCRTPCSADADCPPDAACLCRSRIPWPTGGSYVITRMSLCIPAACRSSADCDGRRCGLSLTECGPTGFFCRSPDDACRGDGDCPGGGECRWVDADAGWRCVDDGAVCE